MSALKLFRLISYWFTVIIADVLNAFNQLYYAKT